MESIGKEKIRYRGLGQDLTIGGSWKSWVFGLKGLIKCQRSWMGWGEEKPQNIHIGSHGKISELRPFLKKNSFWEDENNTLK